MGLDEQLEKLYKIVEEIRIVQESGLWEPLHDAKWHIIKLVQELEGKKKRRLSNDQR